MVGQRCQTQQCHGDVKARYRSEGLGQSGIDFSVISGHLEIVGYCGVCISRAVHTEITATIYQSLVPPPVRKVFSRLPDTCSDSHRSRTDCIWLFHSLRPTAAQIRSPNVVVCSGNITICTHQQIISQEDISQLYINKIRQYTTIEALDYMHCRFLDNMLLAVWLSGNALASINVVALRQTRLVSGWVTICGRVNHLDM